MKKSFRKFFIGYLRMFLFIAVFSPGFYLSVKAAESDLILLYILAAIASLSGVAVYIKFPEVIGHQEPIR